MTIDIAETEPQLRAMPLRVTEGRLAAPPPNYGKGRLHAGSDHSRLAASEATLSAQSNIHEWKSPSSGANGQDAFASPASRTTGLGRWGTRRAPASSGKRRN